MASSRYDFTIALKPQSKPVDLFSIRGFPQCLSNEFATRYLEQLGASPNIENIQHLLECLPVEKCSFVPELRRDGFLNDAVLIRTQAQPGGGGGGSTLDLLPQGTPPRRT